MNGPIVKDYYSYSALVSSLASGASQSASISIEADSEFVAVKYSYFVDIAGATQTDATKVVPLISMELTDTGSGRSLQNIALPIDTIAGRGDLPFILPQPRRFKAKSTIQFRFTNYSAATTYANIYFVMSGYKVFTLG